MQMESIFTTYRNIVTSFDSNIELKATALKQLLYEFEDEKVITSNFVFKKGVGRKKVIYLALTKPEIDIVKMSLKGHIDEKFLE